MGLSSQYVLHWDSFFYARGQRTRDALLRTSLLLQGMYCIVERFFMSVICGDDALLCTSFLAWWREYLRPPGLGGFAAILSANAGPAYKAHAKNGRMSSRGSG